MCSFMCFNYCFETFRNYACRAGWSVFSRGVSVALFEKKGRCRVIRHRAEGSGPRIHKPVVFVTDDSFIQRGEGERVA